MANESVTIVQSPNSVTVTQSTNTTAAATSNPAAGLGGGGTIQGSLDITQNLDVDGSLETVFPFGTAGGAGCHCEITSSNSLAVGYRSAAVLANDVRTILSRAPFTSGLIREGGVTGV